VSIEARNVTKRFDNFIALDDVTLRVEPGQLVALLGPSGSGKTTLLTILAGLIAPDRGRVDAQGRVAFVLQGYGLVSLLSAIENVEVALRAIGRAGRDATDLATVALDRVGLSPYAEHLVDELSGGQQQRTAVARALALEPDILLADEPTAEQDPQSRELVLDQLLGVASTGAAVVIATHDPEVAVRCDHVVELRAGKAVIQR
jgi:putative ABC transport system ATP-binding protein